MIFRSKESYFVILIHLIAIYSIFKIKNVSIYTILLNLIILFFAILSITGGYHRLWSHKSYKANPLLELFYMIFGTTASQSDVITWAKYHRTHHRNEDKDGDPHNINKGFFHAHAGWLLFPWSEKVKDEVSKSDVSDLENNKILKFQKNNYIILWILITFVIPILICSLWGDVKNCFYLTFIRIVIVLHITWSANSLAHSIGEKPYNNDLTATENFLISLLTFGEGWHNYHHSYPKDYRASEKGKYNPTTTFIDLTKKLGLSKDHTFKCKNKKIPKVKKFEINNYCKY